MTPKIKICCIGSEAEAAMAVQYGASALGLVGRMPGGPGVIEDDQIRQIAKTVPPPVSTFLLTSETIAGSIIDHHQRVHTSVIQLVDRVEESVYSELRKSLPGVKLVQVIHVVGEESVDEAVRVSAFADVLLLDSGNPDLKIKVLGGSGKTHNWNLSRKIRDTVDIPVFLAGGINKENIQRAVEQVEPFGVDLCSSVRTSGRLDEKKLEAFFEVAGRI